MAATITLTLSESAQRAALIAGQPAQGNADAAAAEAAILEALRAPLDSWIGPTYSAESKPCVQEWPIGVPEPASADRRDPRLIARRAEAERALLPAAIEDWERPRREFDGAIRTVAARYGELARAAAEGYPVERQVLDALAQDLGQAAYSRVRDSRVRETLHYEIDSLAYDSPALRPAPLPDAFRLLDLVTAEVARANESLPETIGRWSVSKIVRVDTCPHPGKDHKITVVLATLRHATRGVLREVTFSWEDLECGHDDDDE